MSIDPTPEDMGAIAEDGDLVRFLLSLSGRTPKKQAAPAAEESTVAKGPFTGPLHRPGAWPAGTRPAGPTTCDPDCECALNDPPTGSQP